MKKILALAAVVVSLTTFGAWEKVATIRLADVDTLVKGVTRIGEFTGNQMLGIMVSPYIGQLPPVLFFGPGRTGASMALVVSAKKDFAGETDELSDAMDVAVLYPVSVKKDAFLAIHSDAVVTNGLICVCETQDDDADDDEGQAATPRVTKKTYVAFSTDGKWASMSSNPDLVKGALDEIKATEKKMDGNLAQLTIASTGWKSLARVVEEGSKEADMKEADRKTARLTVDLLRQILSLDVGLRVDERGVDSRFAFDFAKGSDLSKVGRKTIAPGAADMLPKDAVCLALNAEDSGTKLIDFRSVFAILKKHGIEFPFLTLTEPAPNYSVFTMDVQKLLDYKMPTSNVCEKVELTNLVDELGALTDGDSLVPLKSPAAGAALVVKGVKPATDLRTLFETMLPEAKGQPLCGCGIFMYYTIIKTCIGAYAPKMLAKAKPAEKVLIESMLSALPPDGEGCVAGASWVKNARAHGILRISVKEIKGLAACVSAFTAIDMQRKMKAKQKKAK